MKELIWLGSSKRDLYEFPAQVRREIGYALHVAQKGDTDDSVKQFKGHGSGIYEVVSNYNGNAFRTVYIVNLNDKVYVLHAFQKKSKHGIKTPKEEVEVIKQRLKLLKAELREAEDE